MSTFKDRLLMAFRLEQNRRVDAGEPKLTRTDLWKAAKRTSGAATHWFNGANGMDMDACIKVAPLLKVNPFWLFNESCSMNATTSDTDNKKSPARLSAETEHERTIAEINKTLHGMSLKGLHVTLGRVTEIAQQYPHEQRKKAS